MSEQSGDDWKEAARREREEASERIEGKGAGLEGNAAAKAGPKGAPGDEAAADADAVGDEEIPPASLAMLVMRLAAEARFHLRLVPKEAGVEVPDGPPDLKLARFVIDLVGVLEAKTEGNREEPESQLIRAVLDDLRLAFVEASKGGGGSS